MIDLILIGIGGINLNLYQKKKISMKNPIKKNITIEGKIINKIENMVKEVHQKIVY
mgnify:CR=1 FL=1